MVVPFQQLYSMKKSKSSLQSRAVFAKKTQLEPVYLRLGPLALMDIAWMTWAASAIGNPIGLRMQLEGLNHYESSSYKCCDRTISEIEEIVWSLDWWKIECTWRDQDRLSGRKLNDILSTRTGAWWRHCYRKSGAIFTSAGLAVMDTSLHFFELSAGQKRLS